MNLLSARARAFSPYTAGEQPKDKTYIKLNANENPYPPSPKVKAAIAGFDFDRLRLYPSLDASPLKREIAAAEGVKEENVFCANGSDEVLAFSFAAFFDPQGQGACFGEITYSFYEVYAALFQVPAVKVPLNGDFTFDFERLKNTPCQGYFIANPNAPTSIGAPLEQIESFVSSVPDRIVIVDEAYVDFFGQSAVPLIEKYPNLLVVKTFSKSYSLAGIRCGYAVGNASLIDGLVRVKDCFNSYPVDSLCIEVCRAALADREYHEKTVSLVKSERERLRDALLGLGFTVPKSDTNFLFAGRAKVSAKEIFTRLKEAGIFVRYWEKPVLCEFCRITVGTRAENDKLIEQIKKILS